MVDEICKTTRSLVLTGKKKIKVQSCKYLILLLLTPPHTGIFTFNFMQKQND